LGYGNWWAAAGIKVFGRVYGEGVGGASRFEQGNVNVAKNGLALARQAKGGSGLASIKNVSLLQKESEEEPARLRGRVPE
jgi:hypothetical protein